MDFPNFIPDQNPFSLGGPPTWFQKQLWEFDDSLVIVPSRQGFYYRLAQRRKLNLPEHIVNDVMFKESDTQMLAAYGLVPVTTILATVNWGNPFLFEELAARAPWRQGGAAKVNQRFDAADRKDRLDRAIKNDEMLTDIAKDAWKYYNIKTGNRTSTFSHKTREPLRQPGSTSPAIRTRSKALYQPDVHTVWRPEHSKILLAG